MIFCHFGLLVARFTSKMALNGFSVVHFRFFGRAMTALERDSACVTGYVRNLRGGSQPILAQASDGQLYVVKFTNNLQGANLPFNESMGSELYRACGLAVPQWKPLLVHDSFIEQNQDCWMQTPEGRLRPERGLCFGSRYLGGDGMRLLEILPGNSFKRVRNLKSFWLAWMIDICAQHTDNRQSLFQEDDSGRLNAFFVDHGHMFGGPKGEHQPRFQASHYLDYRVYRSVSSQYLLSFQKIAGSLDLDQLWKCVQKLPDNWKTQSAFDRFAQCLHRLSNASLLQNILETMVDFHRRTNERKDAKSERKPPRAVLCLGVPATGTGQRLSETADNYRACA